MFAAALAVALFLVFGSSTDRERGAEAREVRRIQAHFDSALAELASRDVPTLTPAQRSRRATLVATLAAYRDRGLFPHNYDTPGRMVPSFVDERTGIRCAVGQLLASTGRDDIVRRVARENLHVYAAELGTDTAFAAWLDVNGLTLAEASRIQPSYLGATANGSDGWIAADFGAAVGSIALAGSNLIGNLDGHHTWLSGIGFATGFASVALGGYTMSSNDAKKNYVASLAMGAGVISIATSAVVAMRHTAKQSAPKEARVSLSPWAQPVSPTGNHGVGLAARIRF